MGKKFAIIFSVVAAVAPLSAVPSYADDNYPLVAGVRHEQVRVNDLDMHLAEAGEGPLVILLHGFPELWYSWRDQLPALADAGFHVVAPDMRGYGATAQLGDQDAYDILHVCGDVIGIMDHFGQDQAILIGHDWGGAIAVQCAQLQPERVRALVDISVPYRRPRFNRLPTEFFREQYGDQFFYMLYFQEDAAEQELNSRTAEVFRKFFVTPGAPRAEASITDSLASAGGFLDRIGEPLASPDWMTPEEIGYFTQVFEETGFLGGLNYYRNLDRNAVLLREQAQPEYAGPTLFVAGEEDFLVAGQTRETLETSLRTVTPQASVALLPGVGHWTMDQAPDELNELLLGFLAQVYLTPKETRD